MSFLKNVIVEICLFPFEFSMTNRNLSDPEVVIAVTLGILIRTIFIFIFIMIKELYAFIETLLLTLEYSGMIGLREVIIEQIEQLIDRRQG